MTTTQPTINDISNRYFPTFETELSTAIEFSFNDARKPLEDAIHYCVKSNGKRIRPLICMATQHAINNQTNSATIIAIAIELIHCYSSFTMIYQQLQWRFNGKPTCHKVFGDDIAILAGDVLNTYVFEYISKQLPMHTTESNTLRAIQSLAHACGPFGMAGGQVLDLKSSINQTSSLQQLQTIHALKTGALLELCFELPCALATNNNNIIAKMKDIGTEFGLLFQIIDDILDETATFEDIGKSPGKDKIQNKLTYPSLLGLTESLNEAKNTKTMHLKLWIVYQ